MARINSKYNYRIAKKSKSVKKAPIKKLAPDKIVIRNNKVSKKVDPPSVPEKKVSNIEKKKNIVINPKPSKKVPGSVTLEDLKNYCSDKKIILVGNSQEIISQPYGSRIDSYDIVVRMNHGHPLNKYAKQMGTKYNIWSHGFLSHKSQIKEYKGIRNIIDYHIETNENKLCKKMFDDKAFLISKKWYKDEFEKTHKGKEMSTGLNTATFFIKLVGTMKEISIVGFDFLRTTNRILHSAPARRFHDPNIEESVMTSLLLDSGRYSPFNDNYNFVK